MIIRWHCPECGKVAFKPTSNGYSAMIVLNRIPSMPGGWGKHKECGKVIRYENLILKVDGEIRK